MGKLYQERGFTLIELSIVLVIIGLIVGGVLVGQDLIRAAQVRATISQIESRWSKLGDSGFLISDRQVQCLRSRCSPKREGKCSISGRYGWPGDVQLIETRKARRQALIA